MKIYFFFEKQNVKKTKCFKKTRLKKEIPTFIFFFWGGGMQFAQRLVQWCLFDLSLSHVTTALALELYLMFRKSTSLETDTQHIFHCIGCIQLASVTRQVCVCSEAYTLHEEASEKKVHELMINTLLPVLAPRLSTPSTYELLFMGQKHSDLTKELWSSYLKMMYNTIHVDPFDVIQNDWNKAKPSYPVNWDLCPFKAFRPSLKTYCRLYQWWAKIPKHFAFRDTKDLPKIGQGTFGTVHRLDKSSQYVMKTCHTSLDKSEILMFSFIRELSAMIALHEVHHMIQLRQVHFTPRLQLVMDYVNGCTPIDYPDTIDTHQVALDWVTTLYEAHNLYGLYHRDLWLSNVLIDQKNRGFICDWGNARLYLKPDLQCEITCMKYCATQECLPPESLMERFYQPLDTMHSVVWMLGCCFLFIAMQDETLFNQCILIPQSEHEMKNSVEQQQQAWSRYVNLLGPPTLDNAGPKIIKALQHAKLIPFRSVSSSTPIHFVETCVGDKDDKMKRLLKSIFRYDPTRRPTLKQIMDTLRPTSLKRKTPPQ